MSATSCALTVRYQKLASIYAGARPKKKEVDASAISVETLNGTVMLSGFAKNATEKVTAESIARKVNGVKAVKNEIAIRP